MVVPFNTANEVPCMTAVEVNARTEMKHTTEKKKSKRLKRQRKDKKGKKEPSNMLRDQQLN